MRKYHEATATRHQSGIIAFIGSLVFLLILFFAESASGSCLSYGHSCWGAHGKRSNNAPGVQLRRSIDAHRDGGLVAEVETDENAPSPRNHDRWILSRLITGRLTVPAAASTVGKRRSNRWHETQKIVAFPGNWNTDYDSTKTENLRDQTVANAESIENEKSVDDTLELTRKLLEPPAEATELLLLPSRDEFDNQPIRARKIRLFKILTDASDDRLK